MIHEEVYVMNKDDKNVEQIIEELTKEEMARMQKQAQKQWRKIPFPLSLHDALNRYTKADLDGIRKYLEIKNASKLKKAEIVHLLEKNIPDHLYPSVLLWDKERFNMLLKIAENNGKIMAPDLEMDEMEYLRHTGFIYTGTWEGNKVFALPNELYDPILALKHDLHVRATIKRNTKWIKLTRGLLYYYGVLDPVRLIQMVEKYMKEPIDVTMYFKVIADSTHYCPEITVDTDSFSHIDVLEPKEVKREQQLKESIPYYDFTEKQLLEAGAPGFVERNASYQQFVHFLTKNFDMDIEDADMIVEECTYTIKSGDSPNQVISYLSQMLEFDSEQLVKAVMDKVIHLMNNTRGWVLKGHTPDEAFGLEKKHLQPMPETKSNSKISGKTHSNPSQKVVKIGRNQPCPCGSGKKHKKCCGK